MLFLFSKLGFKRCARFVCTPRSTSIKARFGFFFWWSKVNKKVLLGVFVVTVALAAFLFPTILAHAESYTAQTVSSNSFSAQTITLSSIAGGFKAVGSNVNGSASGSIVLQLSHTYKSGYTFSVISCTLDLAGQTLQLTGSAQSGRYMRNLVGELEGSGSAIFYAHEVTSVNGVRYYVFHFDVEQGSSEYLVTLIMGG
jgi:hypothetical protein